MAFTASELKTNLGKHFSLAVTEDVYITHYGKRKKKEPLNSYANDPHL